MDSTWRSSKQRGGTQGVDPVLQSEVISAGARSLEALSPPGKSFGIFPVSVDTNSYFTFTLEKEGGVEYWYKK